MVSVAAPSLTTLELSYRYGAKCLLAWKVVASFCSPEGFKEYAAFHKQSNRARLHDVRSIGSGNLVSDNHDAPINHANRTGNHKVSCNFRGGEAIQRERGEP